MTPKQQRFVAEYLRNPEVATAIEAGYSQNTAEKSLAKRGQKQEMAENGR
jgi:phage terminase small subunit